jgi:hypothetical protein
VPARDSTIELPDRLPGGVYSVRVQASDAAQFSTARADVLVGRTLPVAYAREVIGDRSDLLPALADLWPMRDMRCRRATAERVE